MIYPCPCLALVVFFYVIIRSDTKFDSDWISYMCSALLMGRFFFFQAEDGIRDLTVTGVQTCALPISTGREFWVSIVAVSGRLSTVPSFTMSWTTYWPGRSTMNEGLGAVGSDSVALLRSEERRVGKECRSRWSPYH